MKINFPHYNRHTGNVDQTSQRLNSPTMLLPRMPTTGILPSLRNIGAGGCGSNSGILQQVRHATHKASKAANGSSNTAGKRLGAKKTAGTPLPSLFSSPLRPPTDKCERRKSSPWNDNLPPTWNPLVPRRKRRHRP